MYKSFIINSLAGRYNNDWADLEKHKLQKWNVKFAEADFA